MAMTNTYGLVGLLADFSCVVTPGGNPRTSGCTFYPIRLRLYLNPLVGGRTLLLCYQLGIWTGGVLLISLRPLIY